MMLFIVAIVLLPIGAGLFGWAIWLIGTHDEESRRPATTLGNSLPPRTCPDCAHDPGKCIHPMDFTEINELLRRIREQASNDHARRP